MSTTPLLQSPVQSPVYQNVPRYDIILHRYMLSYSAACPCLVRPFVQLFEKALLPRWVSHYAISIKDEHSPPSNSGDRQFELRREGNLPFASIAYFTISDCGLERDNLVSQNEKIGTTTFKPEDVIQEIKKQDRIYQAKDVAASNCLLDVPREYSLLQANCQHFILELIRRIGISDESNAYAELEEASRRPRTWCRFLLSGLGFLLNTAFVLLPLESMTCTLVYMYHLSFSLIMIQDHTMRKLRIELAYNEQRFLDHAVMRHRKRKSKKSALSNRRVLAMLSLWMASPLIYGAFRLFQNWGHWATALISVIILCYYAYVFVAAGILLKLLKSPNAITHMRDRDRKARVEKAYDMLTDRWLANDDIPRCPEAIWWQSEPCDKRCRKCFLDKARREQDYMETSFSLLDFEAAVAEWESNHQRPIEIRKSYEKKYMLGIYAVVVIPCIFGVCLYALHVYT